MVRWKYDGNTTEVAGCFLSHYVLLFVIMNYELRITNQCRLVKKIFESLDFVEEFNKIRSLKIWQSWFK